MEEMQKSWEQKLAEAKAKEAEHTSQTTSSSSAYDKVKEVPHLVNLNEDP
jgi:hypothetical protein